jgi:nucleotidyltransferase/DNA polymerase involved in DNA repair
MSEEPPAKKTKTGWENHQLNCNKAVMKADEGKHLKELAQAPIEALQGIGKVHGDVLKHLGVETVMELATYKYFLMARGLKTLAEVEEKGKRHADSVMNVDHGIDKAEESKSFTEMVESPIHIIEGVTTDAEELFKTLGVKSVGDLAEFKYCRWAEAIVEMAKYEESLDEVERRKARELKKLST